MLEGSVVVDAVVHPYDLGLANQDPAARSQLEAVYAAHVLATGEGHQGHRLTAAEFFVDFPFQAVARALFVEGSVDVAILHALPNLGFTRGYVTDPERAAAFRDLHPGRLGLYATVDTSHVDDAIAQLEFQVRELGVDGLKLYPSFFYEGTARGWRMDADDFAGPLLEAARDLGVRNIAVHKALWLPPAPRSAFAVDDLSAALDRFSDLNFFMVHAGTAFVAQTCELLSNHDNFFATLESAFAYIVVRPDVFAAVLARLLSAAGSERLLFASGANLCHPEPLLAAFAGYQLPEHLLDEHGVPQLTREDRADILGGNALRLHGRSAESVVAATVDDVFARERSGGHVPPWSGLRAMDGGELLPCQ